MAESVPLFYPTIDQSSRAAVLEQRVAAALTCPVSVFQVGDPQRTPASYSSGNGM